VSYLEGELLQRLGQARKALVPGAGLCDNGQARHGTGDVSAGELDALRITGLVGKGAGGRGGQAAVLLLP